MIRFSRRLPLGRRALMAMGLAGIAVLLTGCNIYGPQTTLQPASDFADQIQFLG